MGLNNNGFCKKLEVEILKKVLAILFSVLLVTASFASCASEADISGGESGNFGSETYGDTDVIYDGALSNDGANSGANSGANQNAGNTSEGDGGSSSKPAVTNVKDSSAGLQFTLNADGVSYTLTGKGTFSGTDLVVDGYKGLPVTKIGYGVFADDSKLKTIKIGNYVEEIDDHAFSMCKAVTSVTMGSNVKVIGVYAFRYCQAITSIDLSANVQVLKYGAFYKASKLATIKVSDKLRYIGEYAFSNTAYYNDSSKWSSNILYLGNHLIEAKSSVSGKPTIKSGTVSIAEKAFTLATGITGVSIPDSVKSLSPNAFFKCRSLKSVSGGNGLTYVGDNAFAETSFQKTSSNYKNNLLYVGKCVVDANTSLSGSPSFASGTIAIADMAFASCAKITEVNIPEGVVYVGRYAFLNCEKLAKVTVPSSVKEIGAYAFKG